ncbi:hypothetical protein BpHYR1_051771 [Brachionus plicatilis]|uniref:Uncharacterized protein n=1 Tax=Brachionus plicatilis TaxID=10195 RepID=A0A3M7R716_BRAPC|nr:hypothetical protein BpHYR1_051771 [Brachionus plicatilis]
MFIYNFVMIDPLGLFYGTKLVATNLEFWQKKSRNKFHNLLFDDKLVALDHRPLQTTSLSFGDRSKR